MDSLAFSLLLLVPKINRIFTFSCVRILMLFKSFPFPAQLLDPLRAVCSHPCHSPGGFLQGSVTLGCLLMCESFMFSGLPSGVSCLMGWVPIAYEVRSLLLNWFKFTKKVHFHSSSWRIRSWLQSPEATLWGEEQEPTSRWCPLKWTYFALPSPENKSPAFC